jgi:hypothetical protein
MLIKDEAWEDFEPRLKGGRIRKLQREGANTGE